ncbi:MAG: ADP-ribosylation factor-like protein [Promethearchaeota archaeon]
MKKKVIISGLDNAGKTSILTALDKKFDFQKDIMELKPTIRIEYHKTVFLGANIFFWDMGGQKKYREIYKKREDIYFSETDLLIYVIDIQDKKRFEESLDYLNSILAFFVKNKMDVPIIISFHKYDPELKGYPELNENVIELREYIIEKYPSFQFLHQQTSIYDIISIIQLISYGLSIFDHKFFELSLLLEKYLIEFNCSSLIIFDKNGIIISEYYKDEINPELYVQLIELIKEHLFLLKRIQEEDYKEDYNFTSMENNMLSYLHRLEFKKEIFFISVQIKEELKELLLERFSDFLVELTSIIESLLS